MKRAGVVARWWSRVQMRSRVKPLSAQATVLSQRATAQAEARGMAPSVDDLAVLCLTSHDVDNLLADLDLDPAVLLEQLQAALTRDARPDEDTGSEAQRLADARRAALVAALRGALMRSLARTPAQISMIELFIECVARKPCHVGALLDGRGVTARRLALAYAHRLTEEPGPGELDETLPMSVVVTNDDFTTMEQVEALFQEQLGLPKAKARALMLEIHEKGSAVVFTGDAREARDVWSSIHARAAADGSALLAFLT